MNHAVVTEHLADYLEGDLALDLRALVDAHLDTCEICGQEVREMQQTIRLLRALPEPETPPLIAANVMRRIRAGETRPNWLERIQRALGGVLEPSFVLPASAIAVAALVIVVIQGGGPLSGSLVSQPERTQTSVAQTPLATILANPGSGLAEEVDRSFGASAARELAVSPAPLSRSSSTAPEDRSDMARLAEPLRQEMGPTAALAGRDPMVATPWQPEQFRRGLVPRSEGEGSYFGDPVLAQGFASEVSGPAASVPSNRLSDDFGTAVPLALSRRVRTDGQGLGIDGAGGEDPRDLWLARALEHPADFARYIAGHNLAEQELWVERLSERAQARGLLGELVDALRGAGDAKASWLAADFAAEAKATDSDPSDPTNGASGGTQSAEGAGPGR